MNYAGFCKPVASWLHTDMPAGSEYLMMGLDVPWPRLGGEAVVAAMRAFRAGVPWESVTHSWNLLDSHDSPRFRSCVGGSTALHAVGIGLQMTLPGVPMIFAGDEIGLEGSWGEDARRTMPWDHRDRWDGDLLEAFRRLIALRQRSVALRQGGMRHVHTSADAIAYLRETRDERVLCLAARAPHDPIRLPLAALGCTGTHTLEGDDARVFDDLLELPVTGPAFHAWKLEGPVQ
jgi:alpha-glucosidase